MNKSDNDPNFKVYALRLNQTLTLNTIAGPENGEYREYCIIIITVINGNGFECNMTGIKAIRMKYNIDLPPTFCVRNKSQRSLFDSPNRKKVSSGDVNWRALFKAIPGTDTPF